MNILASLHCQGREYKEIWYCFRRGSSQKDTTQMLFLYMYLNNLSSKKINSGRKEVNNDFHDQPVLLTWLKRFEELRKTFIL